jgi:hypothetical protein
MYQEPYLTKMHKNPIKYGMYLPKMYLLCVSFSPSRDSSKQLNLYKSFPSSKETPIPVHATGTNSKNTLFLNKQESKNNIFVCESAIK